MLAQPTDEELFSALDSEQYFNKVSEAANSLDLSLQAYRYRLNTAKKVLKGYEPQFGEPVDGFQTPNLPDR